MYLLGCVFPILLHLHSRGGFHMRPKSDSQCRYLCQDLFVLWVKLYTKIMCKYISGLDLEVLGVEIPAMSHQKVC